jgi:hypothetical protein
MILDQLGKELRAFDRNVSLGWFAQPPAVFAHVDEHITSLGFRDGFKS